MQRIISKVSSICDKKRVSRPTASSILEYQPISIRDSCPIVNQILLSEQKPLDYEDLGKLQFELEEVLADVMHRIRLMQKEMDSKNIKVSLEKSSQMKSMNFEERFKRFKESTIANLSPNKIGPSTSNAPIKLPERSEIVEKFLKNPGPFCQTEDKMAKFWDKVYAEDSGLKTEGLKLLIDYLDHNVTVSEENCSVSLDKESDAKLNPKELNDLLISVLEKKQSSESTSSNTANPKCPDKQFGYYIQKLSSSFISTSKQATISIDPEEFFQKSSHSQELNSKIIKKCDKSAQRMLKSLNWLKSDFNSANSDVARLRQCLELQNELNELRIRKVTSVVLSELVCEKFDRMLYLIQIELFKVYKEIFVSKQKGEKVDEDRFNKLYHKQAKLLRYLKYL